MQVIGLTGGIGSGKSTVSEFLKILGIPVYNADNEAKKLYEQEDFCLELRNLFGDDVFDLNNKPDKKKIAAIVFNNPLALKKLTSLIHPKVIDDFKNWTNSYNGKANLVVQENAILFESGFEFLFSKIVCVYTPVDVAIKRVIGRDGITPQQVIERMNNQMSIDEKAAKSHHIIYSNEKQLVLPQVLEIFNKL